MYVFGKSVSTLVRCNCKAIMDTIDVKIGFDSEPGKGSTFWAWSKGEGEIIVIEK